MDHMVYSALRRKLAAAQANGDLERIDRLRGMMAVPAEAPAEAPLEVPAIDEARVEAVRPSRFGWLESDE